MSERTARFIVALLAVFIVAQLALVLHLWRQSRAATIAVRVTNAGVPLAAADARVWVHAASDTDQIVAEGPAAEELAVPPGTYAIRVADVRARDGHAVWEHDVEVGPGTAAALEVALSAGELQVDAEDGASPAEPAAVVVYVFRPGDHDTIVTTMGPGEPVRLAAGRYDVRAVLTERSEEKSIVWLDGVEVDAGLRASRSVAFRRGTLRVDAYNAGRKLLAGAVGLTVIQAGDSQEEEVERGSAGVALGLPLGRYDVRATFIGSNDEPTRWLRGIEISERQTLERRVDFASGTAVIHARAGGGAVGPFEAYAYFYRAGDHRQPVTYAPAGEPVLLAAGHYDVRVNYFRAHDRPDVWRYDLPIEAGSTMAETIDFDSGRLIVRAFGGEGQELVGDDVFLYVYVTGQHSRPIVTARAGELVVLAAGTYDLRAADTRQGGRSLWIRRLALAPGALVERSVRLR